MVEISDSLKNILTWIAIIVALIGGIMAAIGVGQIVAALKSMTTLLYFVIFTNLFVWIILTGTTMIINPALATLGAVLAIVGSGLLLFLKINDQFLEGGV